MGIRIESRENAVDAGIVEPGMSVYTRGGKRLGVVREVWAQLPGHGHVAKSRHAIGDYGPIGGTIHLYDGADGYVQVVSNPILPREGDVDLVIPLDEVDDVGPGRIVVVDTGESERRKGR